MNKTQEDNDLRPLSLTFEEENNLESEPIQTYSMNLNGVGETEISLGSVEASRKVLTSTDWSAAWRHAARVTSYVFPHRIKELEDYAEYIENEFATKNPTSHHRIILYDVAVRNLVCGGQQLLLTDIHRFFSLYSAIVMPDGIQYGNQQGTMRRREELCNRFNDKGCKATNC